jgi:glycosyltransferase involved in cell wall biosynthesis
MDILVIAYAELSSYPPIISLVKHLLNLGYRVNLIVRNAKKYRFDEESNVAILDITDFTHSKYSAINRIRRIKLLHKYFDEYKDNSKYIWTCTDYTVLLLGDRLLSCDNHIMQLMELVNTIPRYNNKLIRKIDVFGLFNCHLGEYGRHARAVVVPEINRAHITKAWWQLDKTPFVLPNKPYDIPQGSPKRDTDELLSKIKNGKKTILYQGIIGKERKLDAYAEAIRLLGEEYQLCVMGQDSQVPDQRIDINKEYPDAIRLGYIAPPEHLYITKAAYIGILSYIPQRGNELNVLYCAPNKIYEYAGCGIPMICHALPALIQVFEQYQIGVCVKEMTAAEIAKGIREIENNYEKMRENCFRFYENTDMRLIIKSVLSV